MPRAQLPAWALQAELQGGMALRSSPVRHSTLNAVALSEASPLGYVQYAVDRYRHRPYVCLLRASDSFRCGVEQ